MKIHPYEAKSHDHAKKAEQKNETPKLNRHLDQVREEVIKKDVNHVVSQLENAGLLHSKLDLSINSINKCSSDRIVTLGNPPSL